MPDEKVPPSEPAAPASGPPGPDPAEPTAFMMLCGGLAAQVQMALGLIEDPVEKKPKVELDAAQQGIDLLVTLQQKTRGNLEPREEKLLGGLLTQLRLIYVEVAKARAALAEGS